MATTCKLIAKQTLGSSAATISFSSIPGTYTDLMIVCSTRTDRSGADIETLSISLNGSTTSFSNRWLDGTGSAARSGTDLYSGRGCSYTTGATATANTFGSGTIYIPNYAGSSNKSFSGDAVQETNSSTAYILAVAGLWSNTAAITSIGLVPQSGSNFVSGSSFFLYGITKA